MTEWKLVPVEPTEAMWKAADKQSEFCAIHNYGASPSAEDYWHAMLDAAPALENGPAGLADATPNQTDPDLSSLRKGAEVGPIPIIETFAINPIGEGDITVEGGGRFAHERDVQSLMAWARSAEAALRLKDRA